MMPRMSTAPEEQDDPLVGRYTGTTGGILMLSLRTGLLSLFTLGIYRFWARTRIRRYVWSATSPGGDPFEYTGTGLEKLLGFLVAIVILAVVLGLVQLGLFFIGLSLFTGYTDEAELAIQIALAQTSLLVLLPLILIAQYRSRRYMMSRTRWRGLRFAMDNGAVGYMWRAIGHSLLTGLTLGILLPRQTYWLNKYKIDRSWYGNTKFEMGGYWQMLYPAMVHLLIGAALTIVGAVGMAFNPIMGSLFGLGYMWLFVGSVIYRVRTFTILAGETTLGGSVAFKSIASSASVIGRLIVGSLIMSLVFAVAAGLYVGLLFLAGLDVTGDSVPGTPFLVVAGLGAMLLFALMNALSMAFVTQPVISHIVTSTAVMTPRDLSMVRQREADDMVDADGFADALDVGAAI